MTGRRRRSSEARQARQSDEVIVSQSISGLASNLDTSSIIEQLVSIERNSINIVTARKSTANTQLATWSAIRTTLDTLRTTTNALTKRTDWTPLTATSSNASAVTVSAGSGTLSGTLSFTVGSLASAGSVRSANVLSSTAAAVAADAGIFVAAKGATVGFASFASDDALALGKHTIRVTQSSTAATKLGTTALDPTTTIAAGESIVLSVNGGGAITLDNIEAGTWTATQLAQKIQTAADAKGAHVDATVDPTTGALRIATAREGDTASLQITGGSALAKLKLTTDGSDLTGTNGRVQVGDSAEQEFNQIEAGGSVVLNASAGTITATFSGGLRAGSVTGTNVSTGDGSLATVANNINAAGAGVTATAVQVGQGAFRLQINSNSTGAKGGANVATSEFNASIGSLVELTPATDASITVGTGIGAYDVTSDTNTVSGVLPGVTLQLKETTASPVTITVGRDVTALANKVKALVDAANGVRAAIRTATAYNADTKTSSPLTGDSSTRRLVSDLNRALLDAVPFANPASPGLAGVSIDKSGTYTFDQSKFTAAFNADPEGVTRAFTQGGTATDPNVTFVSAGDRARAGTYDVEVTAVATRASTVGLEGAWPIGSPPTVKVRIGTKEVSYAIDGADTQQDVVDALNTRFGEAGLNLVASVSGTGIEVRTEQYGRAAVFDVAWDGSTYVNHQGTDVAGKIGGKDAEGSGQQLSVPFDDTEMGGIALMFTGTTTGALGTFTYEPGVAQRVATSLSHALDVVDGYITSTENSLKSRVKYIEDAVSSMERRLVAYQARLKKQFATLETTLSTLQSQSSWLASQVQAVNAQAAAG
jgi:flagellar hook-associated protein 2